MKNIYLTFLLVFLTLIIYSQNQPIESPINPDFINYINNLKSGNTVKITKDGHRLGYIPSPVVPIFSSALSSPLKKTLLNNQSLPSRYDLRELSLMSSVKDQGTCGDCWTFATCSTLESYCLKLGLGTYNFSENNIKDCNGFLLDPCYAGGEMKMAGAYLARRSGPISESDDPYFDGSDGCHSGFTPNVYITDMRLLYKDLNLIKQTIINYGAIYASFLWDDNSYRESDNTYYDVDNTGSGHAVAIAGWDDNKVTAGGTGAWICKNNWGPGWGEKGYFYISYNDYNLFNLNEDMEFGYFPGMVEYSSNSKIYCYDRFGWLKSTGYGGNTAYGLVKYTATDNNPITKISTWISTAGSSVDITVFGNLTGNILSNQLGTITGQSCPLPGYYTFNLPSSIPMTNGTSFYIKVKYTTPNFAYPIPIEDTVPNYASPLIQTGVSWISQFGNTWTPVGTGTSYNYNLCINAYSTGCPDEYAGVALINPTTVCSGQNVTLSLTGYSGSIQWQWSKDDSTFTNITAGTYTPYISNTTGLEDTIYYRAIVTDAGCGSAGSNVVKDTIVPIPSQPTVNSPIIYTQNETAFQLTSTGSNLLWYNYSNGGIGNAIAFTPTTTSTGTTFYYVTQTQKDCESQRAQIAIIVNPPNLKINITSDNTKICQTLPVTLTASVTGGSDSYSYLWNTGQTSNSFIDFPAVTTTYTLTVTDLRNSITVTGTKIIDVVNISGTLTPTGTVKIIQGKSITLHATKKSGYVYSWFKKSVLLGNEKNDSLVVTEEGNYYAKIVYDICNIVTNVTTVNVIIIPPITNINLSAVPNTICKGDTTKIKAIVIGGSGNFTYEWSNGINTNSFKDEPTTTKGYSVKVTDILTGSWATATITVTVNSATVSISTPDNITSICLSDSIQLFATSNINYSYTWKYEGNRINYAANNNFYAGKTGTYSVIASNQGCHDSASIAVTLNPVPLEIIKNKKGDTTIFTAHVKEINVANNLTYQWLSNNLPIKNTTSISYTPINDGTYAFIINNPNTNCSVLSDTANVRVAFSITEIKIKVNNAKKTLDKNNSITICALDTVQIIPIIYGGSGNFSYNWNTSINNDTLKIIPINSNNYILTITDISENKNHLLSININVNQIPKQFTITGGGIYCSGRPGISIGLNNSESNAIYKLYLSGSITAISSLQGNNSALNFNNLTNEGTYTIIAQNTFGCKSYMPGNVIINVKSVPSIPIVSPVIYCQKSLAGALSATGSNLLWYNASIGGVGQATPPTPSTSIADTTHYYVSQTVISCESDRAEIKVIVKAMPEAPTVSSSIEYCQNDSPSPLKASGINLLWYMSSTGGSGENSSPTPSTSVAETTDYYVSQTVNGCESQRADVKVIVNLKPSTPVVTQNINELVSSSDTGNQWYQIVTGEGTIMLNGATSKTYTPDADGDYFTIVTNNGCSSLPSSIIHYIRSGINESGFVKEKSGILIYPNPNNGSFNIIISGYKTGIYKLEIWDIYGRIVFSKQIAMNNKEKAIYNINVSDITNGIYLLNLNNTIRSSLFVVR